MSAWEIRWSNSRSLPYFYNSSTNQSTWEKPADLSDDAVKSLPGAKYLSGNAQPEGKVRASHILAKHTGSRRPSSWKQVSAVRDYEVV
jgi:NIMA-interacting peptidyl-prolyl cis-trans isomerase 1